MNKILDIEHITVGYDENPLVLKDVNLSVFENDFLGIIGPNGGGKTTLLKTILGLIKPIRGSIRFYEGDKAVSRFNIGYLPQINKIDKNFPISVFDVILSGMALTNRFKVSYSAAQKERAKEVAGQMGLTKQLKKSIGELSGGQIQRALLGRAIVDSPKLLVLDEPNSYVDKQFESDFYKLLESINENTAIILVSHDVGTVLSMVKNIACVNEGLHYHAGADITTEWLEKSYSCPIEILGHGNLPHRVLDKHEGCDCCN
ncbi:metal ABC transporter ATP-binding protein [Dysgonomonas sp. 25]|uniref:metal ABC transporter ATP-binding protein n=1 Tax=Dysgonomonas sp. 25 TaxID=2302933 RepID=UPI0013D6FDC3|nr:ABC transporter ATP-binding protein [Dysgonomonas sp. 25]NDV69574.1 ABC transporter ATP-binding protein [Dysgonomonas sp. 25]